MRLHALSISLSLGAALIISSCAYEEMSHKAPKPVDWRKRAISYGKPQLWNEKHLTWQVDPKTKVPEQLDPKKLHQAVEESFKSWEPAGIFTFSPVEEGETADIVISFEAPPGKTWEQKTGCMGQAAFPWTANRGRIYLDPSQWWTTESFSVFRDPISKFLPHEIGHVLGLQHSYMSNDHTMCVHGPYKQPGEESFSRLRRLYAPKTSVFLPGQLFALESSRKPAQQPFRMPALALTAMEAE